ncbi:MAG TPA: protein-methionine-sulfoxide reductase heme-binding subunit MsrQ [Stellaceae bacterium]|nr:protein-methionine-sulfoxide reductase heme-binding subunit MsrQ [Stellaceae bacterium]
MIRRKRPWCDNSGRLSLLKLAVFIALFLPGARTVLSYPLDALGARPLNEAIHQFGLWGFRFLLISLTITPASQVLQFPRLILVRRMIGVAAAAYIAIHFSLYVGDQMFDLAKVASEVVLRIYLTIGFVALLGLAALAATSTDAMVRRLGGRRWSRLHQTVYVIAILAAIHYFMQRKLEVYEPTVTAGLLLWLLSYRLVLRVGSARRRLQVWAIFLLGAAAGLATAAGEAVYFRLVMGVDPALILSANLTLDVGLRPGWVVFAIGLAMTALAAGRDLAKRQPARLRPA